MLERFAIFACLVGSTVFGSLPVVASEEYEIRAGIKDLLGIYLPAAASSATSQIYLVGQYWRREDQDWFRSRLTLVQPGKEKATLDYEAEVEGGWEQEFTEKQLAAMPEPVRAFMTDASGKPTREHLRELSAALFGAYLGSQNAGSPAGYVLLIAEHEAFASGGGWRTEPPNRDVVVLCEWNAMSRDIDPVLGVLPGKQSCARFDRVPLIDDVVSGKATLEILSALQAVNTPYAMVAGDVSVSGTEIVVSAQPFSRVAAPGSGTSGGWASWFDQINAQTQGGGRRISCIFPMDAASTLTGLDKGTVVSFVPKVRTVTESAVTLECTPYPG